MVDYFIGCKTEQEAKTKFRQLAMQHHPDKGGEVSIMQEVIIQYKKKMKNLDYEGMEEHEMDKLIREKLEEFGLSEEAISWVQFGFAVLRFADAMKKR